MLALVLALQVILVDDVAASLVRAEPVPKVFWSCDLRTAEDVSLIVAGEIAGITASEQKPIKAAEQARTAIRFVEDSSGKLKGQHSANYLDLDRSFSAHVEHSSGDYFLNLQFAAGSGRSYGVLSFSEPNDMSPPEPLALGFCKHSPLEVTE